MRAARGMNCLAPVPIRSRGGDDIRAVRLAFPRQANAPVYPVEQPCPKQALEVLDGAAHGRLRGVELLGGGAEAAEAGSDFEGAQVAHRRERRRLRHSGAAMETGSR